MNTKEITREQISALVDGELSDSQLDNVFASLRDADAKVDWELYHRIGDAMRSEEIASASLSSDFSARLAARLDAEPTIIAPASPPITEPSRNSRTSVRRWALPGAAAAVAMASIAFVATPQLMVASGDRGAVTSPAVAVAEPKVELVSSKRASEQGAVVAATIPNGVVVRDARIDDYLLAHQRFSPSPYSTAQYARSATFAADSSK
jgi:sigma-E factor negative regulatory protein RseA